MKDLTPFCSALVGLALLALHGAAGAADVVVHHVLEVVVDPSRGHLQVVDRLEIPAGAGAHGRVDVALNAGFAVTGLSGARIERREAGARLQVLTLHGGGGAITVMLAYAGSPVLDGGSDGPGEWLDGDGAHLGAGSAWYPRIGDALHTYDLTVSVPTGWRALVPGRALAPAAGGAQRWSSEGPVEDMDLVAGRFTVFRRAAGWGTAEVWLRADDPALAETYLDATLRDVPFYARLLGPYPWSRFTVIENLRATGWGMPGFTLLGARVMRLPFIPHTSLPHEVLHNWWGNGVLVDPREGNWSEGLTAYLADHLIAQRRGAGARERRDSLARFRAAAGEGADTAPVRFRARHDRRSQAVGYDKALMIMHMARRARGDDAFIAALRGLYATGLGRRVGAPELLAAIAPAGEDWFARWWVRPGAPELALECCTVAARADGFRVGGVLRQVQRDDAFALRVPVQILLDGEDAAREYVVVMDAARSDFAIDVPAKPVVLQVDGGFDLMRIPAAAELPPALGELLGVPGAVAVFAPGLPDALVAAYRSIAARVGAREGADAANATAVWVFGRGAPLAAPRRAQLDRQIAAGDSRVMVWRDAAGRSVALVDAASAPAAAALAGRIPHYGRYGLLGFTGDDARNVFKGEVEVAGSPLRVMLDPRVPAGAFPLPAEHALSR